MNPVWYGRIVNTCMAVVVVSVLATDRVDGGFKISIAVCAVTAGLVAVGIYFYNQYLLEKNGVNKVESEAVSSKKDAEEAIRYAVEENNMVESDYIKWMNQIWREIVHELSEDGDDETP